MSERNNSVVLADFANYIDAHIALGQLQEAGIRCWLKDEHSITLNPFLANALGGIKLMVAEVDIDAAKEVLRN